jgi:GDP-4-dehydro-6-deoxy-D-mannose reductase
LWVTGVTGYTGKWLVRYIREKNPSAEIIGLARSSENSAHAMDRYFQLDVCDEAAVTDVARLSAPTIVFHLAGLSPPASEAEMWHVNVGGTLNLLWGLQKANCRETRVICAGSAAEYLPVAEGPVSESSASGGKTDYGRTKWAQTTLARVQAVNLHMHLSVVRPFNIIGPGLPGRLVAGRICEQILRKDNREIHLGDISSERDFIDVRDLVKAYWQVALQGKPGQVYDVCSGVPTRIENLVKIFLSISGDRRKVVSIPRSQTGGPTDRVYGRNGKMVALGWRPEFSLKQSVEDMLQFHRLTSYVSTD